MLSFLIWLLPAFALPSAASTPDWTVEVSPSAMTLNAVSHDGLHAYAVGDGGVIVRRLLTDEIGVGVWTQIPSGTTSDLLDIACRPGVGCAASGWDVVVAGDGSSFSPIVETVGENRLFAPVWLYADAVMYAEADMPQSRLWRKPNGASALSVDVGDEPLTAFCERSGELLSITRRGEVVGFDPLLVMSVTSYFSPVTHLELVKGAFGRESCSVTPGGPGAGKPKSNAIQAFGVDQPDADGDLTFFDLLPTHLARALDDTDVIAISDLMARVEATSEQGGPIAPHRFVIAGGVQGFFEASWNIRLNGAFAFISEGHNADVSVNHSLLGVTAASVELPPTSSRVEMFEGVLEVAVGTNGLIGVRDATPIEIFSSDFETGTTNEWSATQGGVP